MNYLALNESSELPSTLIFFIIIEAILFIKVLKIFFCFFVANGHPVRVKLAEVVEVVSQ